jgi:hypothetical protein
LKFLEFLGIYLRFVWQKTIFIKNNCQNRSKGVFAKQLLRQKIPQQKTNQPNKTLVPDKKKKESGRLEKTSSTLNQIENHGLTQN